MLLKIIEKEIRSYVISSRFVVTFLICTVLIMLATMTGINGYREELRDYTAALALNEQNIESQPSYPAIFNDGIKVNRPPEVLGTIVTGIQNAVGRQATIHVGYVTNLMDSVYDSTPITAVYGELDLTVITKIVLSLFAILFTFDAIVGERERGTLKLMLANQLPRGQLLLGKAVGGLASLLVPLLIPFGMSVLMLMVHPDISLSGEEWVRVGLIMALFVLYMAVFFALGLLVSSRSGSSVSSLFVLLFIWVAVIFIIPKGAVIMSRNLRPIPSVHEITAQKEESFQIARREYEIRSREFGEANPAANEETRRAYLVELSKEVSAHFDERNAGIEREYTARRDAQRDLAVKLSLVSPASALSFGAMSLARTGIEDHERFVDAMKIYRMAFSAWADQVTARNNYLYTPNDGGKPDISDMPGFSHVKSDFSQSLIHTIPEIMVFAFMIVVFSAAAFVSFQRYDAR